MRPGTFILLTEVVRKVSNGIITTVPTGTSVVYASAVAVDAAGHLYIADRGSNRVFEVAFGSITPVAGDGESGYSGDGPATSNALNGPFALAFDSGGALYIADSGNERVRKIVNGMMTTVVGTFTSNYGDGGRPPVPRFFLRAWLSMGLAIFSLPIPGTTRFGK